MDEFDPWEKPEEKDPWEIPSVTQFQELDPWEAPVANSAPEPAAEVSPFAQLDTKLSSYGRPLTKEDFLADPELMDMVRDNIRTRYQDSNLIGSTVTGALGGATAPRGWEAMSDEEVFETWQNYHRSFAGGQTVTTMNEVAYAATVDEQLKAKLGAGYKLFDAMDNAFVGEGTWDESFDAAGDYMAAAIWDPTTVLSLGVGRAFTAGGAKAAGVAIREAGKTAYKAELKKLTQAGVTKEIAEQTAKATALATTQKSFDQLSKATARKAAVGMGAVDMATSVATDIFYQDTMLRTGAQDEYSIPQTALSALGVVVTPALVAAGKLGAKGLEKASRAMGSEVFTRYNAFKTDVVGKDPVQMTNLMKQRIDLTSVNKNLKTSFENFSQNEAQMLSWKEAKDASDDILSQAGITSSVNRDESNFFNMFLFGSGKEKGLIEELAGAGFVFAKRDEEDKISNWVGDAISWLDDDVVETAIKKFEDIQGVTLPFKDRDTMAAAWKRGASDAGYRLMLSRKASDELKEDLPEGDILRTIMTELKREVDVSEKDMPKRFAYVQSVWKRLVTSHPATTGLNVKGWGQMSLMNSTSDLMLGMLNMGEAGFKAATGNVGGAQYAMRKGQGSLLGSLKRGYALLDFNATLDEGMALIEAKPELFEQLFKQGAGDTGTLNALGDFNLQPNKVNNAVEGTVRYLQGATGVVLQDEITKVLSYMTNIDRAILREYGQPYNEFMQRPDVWIEMSSPKFLTNVHAPAMDRTLRETASKSWSTKQGSSAMLHVAKEIERFSNNAVTGYAIPFGRFFNTAMSTFGDYSSINFFRQLGKKALGYKKDASQDETLELMSKGIVGVSAAFYFASLSQDKIKEGLAWNQERRDDGSIKDVTYDFPESFFRSFGQLLGHKYFGDGEIPADLAETVGTHLIGQTFRATEDGIKMTTEFAKAVLEMDPDEVTRQGAEITANFFSGIISGMTRPLDPINQAAMMITDDYSVPDRRQGYEFWNQSFRYVDKIFNVADLPDRAYPTRGTQVTPDMGRTLGGNRSVPENNEVESMLNSIGKESWKAVRWDGDPAVKNRLDEMFAPVVNAYARKVLQKHPDFFNLPLERRQLLVNESVLKPAKDATKKMLQSTAGKDGNLALMEKLTQHPDKKVREVLDKVAPGSSLADLAVDPGGKAKLETLLYMLDHWEETMMK